MWMTGEKTHKIFTGMAIQNFRRSASICEAKIMEMRDLIRALELEYHGIIAANPDWETSLFDFLVSRGMDSDDIWEYSPQIGYDANKPEPDWL